MSEKKTRLLKSATAEFLEMGYNDASTLKIVKNARVSKGLLFHHYQNKEGLFLEIYRDIFDILKGGFVDELDYSSNDVIDRLNKARLAFIKASVDYPMEYEFICKSCWTTPIELYNKLYFVRNISSELVSGVFNNIDNFGFRDGTSGNITQIGSWIIVGFIDSIFSKMRSVMTMITTSELMSLTDDYLESLKVMFYKD